MTTLARVKLPTTTQLITPGLALSAVFGSVLIGLMLMPTFGDLVVWMLVAAAAGVLVMIYPEVGVYALGVTMLAQNLLVFNGRGAGASTGVKLLGMAVFAAWLGGKILRKESFAPLLSAKLLLPCFMFLVLVFASSMWSVKREGTLVAVLTMAQLVALLLLVYDTITSWDKFEWLLRTLVVGGLIAALLTISQANTGVNRAGGDITGNENATAASLTFILPLAFGVLRVSRSNLWRLVGIAYLGAGVIGIILTYSRTSYVGIAIIFAIEIYQIFKARPADRLKFTVAGLAMVAMISASGIIPWDRVLDRSSTINTDLSEDSQQGRIRFWTGAFYMYLDHPVLGVGYRNYGYQFMTHYQFRVEGMTKVIYYEKSHHNTVLGFMGELGTVGIVIWAWINFRGMYFTIWASKRQEERNRVMAQSVLFALLAVTIYGFVSKVDDHKLLWVLLGMADTARRLTLRDLQAAGQMTHARVVLAPRKALGRSTLRHQPNM